MKATNDRGVTMLQMVLVFGALIVIAIMTARSSLSFNASERENRVIADITHLESAIKSYHMVNNRYPVKYAVDISAGTSGTELNRVFLSIKTSIDLSDSEIVTRFKPVDLTLLTNEKYVVRLSSSETFLVDTLDGNVYYTKQFTNGGEKEFAKAKLKIEQSSGLNIALKSAGTLNLTAGGKVMTQVNTSLAYGSEVLVGGSGSMSLAKVRTDLINGAYQTQITDITNLLNGTNTVVGDLKYLGENKVLVHFTDNGVMQYLTIQL